MDDYRIGIVSEPILGVSYRIVSATFVSADTSLQVQQLLTGCITQEIKERSRPVTRCSQMPLIDHDTGVRMLTATLQSLITCHTPALQLTHQTTEQTAEPGD